MKTQNKGKKLTITDDLQRREEVIITHNGHGQKHIKNDDEIDNDAPILSLLQCKKSFWEF